MTVETIPYHQYHIHIMSLYVVAIFCWDILEKFSWSLSNFQNSLGKWGHPFHTGVKIRQIQAFDNAKKKKQKSTD